MVTKHVTLMGATNRHEYACAGCQLHHVAVPVPTAQSDVKEQQKQQHPR